WACLLGGKAMHARRAQPGGRAGAGDEGDAHRLERPRRQRFGREPRPEAVSIARDGHKAGDAGVPHEVVDFAALDVGPAEIASTKAGISLTGPGLAASLGKVLGIGTEVESADRVPPDLPGCGRGP